MSTITVNGKTLQTTHQNVQHIIHELGLDKGRYAVEVDGELVPKSKIEHLSLVDGMIIEVVQAVGGG